MVKNLHWKAQGEDYIHYIAIYFWTFSLEDVDARLIDGEIFECSQV